MKLLLLYIFGLSAVSADYYYSSELCDDASTILFKNNEHSCVCFPQGSYELNSCDDKGPSYFDTYYDSSCVIVPNNTVAITRTTELMKPTINLKCCNLQIVYERRRTKRSTTPDIEDDPAQDEDQAGAGVEIGSEVMRDQMNHYMERKIAQLTGLNAENGGAESASSRSKYPVIKLLDYAKQIMAKTCISVSEDYLDLALNAFVNLQLETFHIKEPYIGYSAYRRIELAMEKCLKKADPHTFYHNFTTETAPGEFCDENPADQVSEHVVMDAGKPGETMTLIDLPDYAKSAMNDTAITEPLIETVWKMLVNAHSYCYIYFSDYFNDHHTYTVALLPLFTNKIQEIWLKGYMLGDAYPDNVLYGGLLGDIKKVMHNVDYCTGASKEASPYPWLINRPPRDKSNVWLGYPCWEDTGVDGEIEIGNHVKLCPGVEDERKTFSEKEMMNLFRDNIHSQYNIVAQQPDWGIFVIPKVQIQSEKFSSQIPPHAVIFIQFNHGYMDGNSAVHFIKTCVFDEEEGITNVEVMRKVQDAESLPHRLIRYFRVIFDSPFLLAKVVIRNKHSIFHVTSPTSEATFVGCSISKIQSSSMNNVRAAFNCGTRSAISFAFLKAMVRVAERKGFSPPKFVNYACTHSIVPYSHLKPQNGFALLVRTIPTSGSDQLVEIDKLFQINEDNEYQLDACLMAFYFMGLMPSRMISLIRNQLAVFPCGVTLVPAKLLEGCIGLNQVA
ncbi:unnamed protein product [Orchesella dallaii]|uniref:Uncharacterized protein n=1 Tax=Orchesella dallaii TaxID=48710 RepID=A0ABP1Q4A8_9HEXA